MKDFRLLFILFLVLSLAILLVPFNVVGKTSNAPKDDLPTASLTPHPISTPEPALQESSSTSPPALEVIPSLPLKEPNSPYTSTLWSFTYLPGILNFETLKTYLVCTQSLMAIPDNSISGAISPMVFTKPGSILGLRIFMKVYHTWVGDLRAEFGGDKGKSAVLFDRPGSTGGQMGCGNDHVQAIFDDRYPVAAESRCGAYPAAIAGIFHPEQPLHQFIGSPASGTWFLKVADLSPSDQGSIQEWCMEITTGFKQPEPTPAPTPITLPPSVSLENITGQVQQLGLDCESRSAVDWARYFGTTIDELTFFSQLPVSDDPEKGFVGDVNGAWGQTPPNSYGVHAGPVAALLRNYGLAARAMRNLNWEDLKAELAAGHPVIAWVTGHAQAGIYESGAPQYYTPVSDQSTTIIAQFEHTVIVIGYSDIDKTVRLLDGADIYNRRLEDFLTSWSMLQNMAILARP